MTTPELPPLTTYDHECMVEDNLGEWVRVIEVEARERILQARISELEADAGRVAAIAHDGGLVAYREVEALRDIRALTVKYWNKSGTRAEAWERVHAAIDAARGNK